MPAFEALSEGLIRLWIGESGVKRAAAVEGAAAYLLWSRLCCPRPTDLARSVTGKPLWTPTSGGLVDTCTGSQDASHNLPTRFLRL